MKTTATSHIKKLTALVAASVAVTVQAQLIDDFNTVGLGEYTQTRILDNSVGEANVSFSDATGALVGSYGGTLNAAEQVLFLRNDFSLAVGSALRLDVLFPTQTSDIDFGLAVSATAAPTAASLADTDTRDTFNWAAVYVRANQNAVRASSATNGAGTVVTAAGVLTADETTVSQLFIERNTDTTFTLGYINTSAVRFTNRVVSFFATDVGTAVGFYGDLRVVGGTLGSLDNLRLEVIPEPATFALLGLGGLACILRLRRRN